MSEIEGNARPGGKRAILLVVVLAFAVLLVWKVTAGQGTATAPAAGETGATLTSRHNDAAADYEAALETDKPVYVLFHSLSCQSCVEISAVADKVMPEYEDRVTFVNAISDDASSQRLASVLPFQFIPQSFFLAPDGTVVDEYTGAMSEAEMRARLDALLLEQQP